MLANGHLALASFLFSNGHAERLVAIIQRKNNFSILLVYIAVLPYFAVIDGTTFCESNFPIARYLIAPISIYDGFGNRTLRLSRHFNEGEQDGDDGFLVHVYFNLFVIVEYLFEFLIDVLTT